MGLSYIKAPSELEYDPELPDPDFARVLGRLRLICASSHGFCMLLAPSPEQKAPSPDVNPHTPYMCQAEMPANPLFYLQAGLTASTGLGF